MIADKTLQKHMECLLALLQVFRERLVASVPLHKYQSLQKQLEFSRQSLRFLQTNALEEQAIQKIIFQASEKNLQILKRADAELQQQIKQKIKQLELEENHLKLLILEKLKFELKQKIKNQFLIKLQKETKGRLAEVALLREVILRKDSEISNLKTQLEIHLQSGIFDQPDDQDLLKESQQWLYQADQILMQAKQYNQSTMSFQDDHIQQLKSQLKSITFENIQLRQQLKSEQLSNYDKSYMQRRLMTLQERLNNNSVQQYQEAINRLSEQINRKNQQLQDTYERIAELQNLTSRPPSRIEDKQVQANLGGVQELNKIISDLKSQAKKNLKVAVQMKQMKCQQQRQITKLVSMREHYHQKLQRQEKEISTRLARLIQNYN